jgi:hypothetical protein
MARDGKYLMALFQVYQEMAVPNDRSIGTQYLRCSRRSVLAGIPSAHTPDAILEPISIRNWLFGIGLECQDLPIQCTDAQLDEVAALENSELYLSLMKNDSFRHLLESTVSNNSAAFLNYIADFIHDGVLRVVDSGWKGTTQLAIQEGYGVPCVGYYIGTQLPDSGDPPTDSFGLVFDEKADTSGLYDFFGTNIPLYQQLLLADEGAVTGYLLGPPLQICTNWDPMEADLYAKRIRGSQESMLSYFEAMVAWCDSESDEARDQWVTAKTMFRSTLYNTGERLNFLLDLTSKYVQNFRQEKRGELLYDPRSAHLGMDILWRPWRYIRYVTKVQRSPLWRNPLVRTCFPVIAPVYYCYTIIARRAASRICKGRV